MKTTTRRAVLAGAPAAAAGALAAGTAVNALAAAMGKAADPIFAAIETHKRMVQESFELSVALDEAEGDAAETYGNRPIALVQWRNYLIGDSEIDRRREALLATGDNPEIVEKEYLEAKADFEAKVRAEDDWDERTGLAPLRAALECAYDADDEAAMRLARTKPTTPAGAGALIQYVCRDDVGEADWHEVALNTVAEALVSIEEAQS
jgi:hypothetical protein